MTTKRTLSFGVAIAAIAAVGISTALRASAPSVPANTWAVTGPMAAARAGASATLLPDGRLLVAGGLTDAGVTASTERYSVASYGFISTPPMGEARANHTATLLPDGRVLIV